MYYLCINNIVYIIINLFIMIKTSNNTPEIFLANKIHCSHIKKTNLPESLSRKSNLHAGENIFQFESKYFAYEIVYFLPLHSAFFNSLSFTFKIIRKIV